MWYYVRNKVSVGPVTEEQLVKLIAAGDITEQTRVWREGMPNWVRAKDAGLGINFGSPPPPVVRPTLTSRPASPGLIGFVDLSRLTNWVKTLLAISLVVALLAALFAWIQIALLARASSGGNISAGEASANTIRQSIIGILQLVVLVVTAIFFLCWVYRAGRNVRTLGARDLKISPGWAVGYYFIPILWLWRPYQAMKEIWKASYDPNQWKTAPTGAIVRIWWTFWILSSVFGWAAFRSAFEEQAQDATLATAQLLISDVIDIPLCLVAFLLVSRISRMQAEAAANWTPGASELPSVVSEPALNTRTSGLAIASLILGIVSFPLLLVPLLLFLCLLTGPAAVICGHIALSKIQKSAGALKGKGFAIAGLVTGYVFIVLGALIALSVARFSTNVKSAHHVEVSADIRAIGTQLMQYEAMNGFYPTTDQGLPALVTQPATDPKPTRWYQFFKEVPKDPWGTPYIYRCPGIKHPDKYDLYSVGPDKKPATADDDWGE